jgi:hypothetical protein
MAGSIERELGDVTEVVAVRDVSLDVKKGEVVLIRAHPVRERRRFSSWLFPW